MKRALLSILAVALAAAPAAAEEHRSKLFLGVEAGQGAGSLTGGTGGRIVGGRLAYDISPLWSAGLHVQSRTYKTKQPARCSIRPVTAALYRRFYDAETWSAYGFGELGLSHNRRIVVSAPRTNEKGTLGLGLGAEIKIGEIHSLALEAAHRRFAGASPSGHQVTENGVVLVWNVHLPDDWVPIHPDSPLNIPDIDDAQAKSTPPPLPDTEKQQAQLELDKVQQDIRDKKIPPIHFETGEAILLKDSFETLDIVGTILRRYPQFSVTIAGHTDDVGSEEDNQILSVARAEVVRAYLSQNFGLPADKLKAEGYGKSKPIADNATEDGRFLNRRVEFTIQP